MTYIFALSGTFVKIIQLGLLNLMLGVLNLSLPAIAESHVFAAMLDLFIILDIIALLNFAYR